MEFTSAKNNELSEEAREILKKKCDQKINVLVVGSTGVGKSSLLNRYLQFCKIKLFYAVEEEVWIYIVVLLCITMARQDGQNVNEIHITYTSLTRYLHVSNVYKSTTFTYTSLTCQ